MTMAIASNSLSHIAAEVARSLVRVSTHGEAVRLSTPLLYPGGTMVGVDLSRLRDSFLVTDAGAARRKRDCLAGRVPLRASRKKPQSDLVSGSIKT
jgi:hypothetical protein